MKLLEAKILQEGRALNENVLIVDSFLNHQVDPMLMDAVGNEFARRFRDEGITRVITIESSGISPALKTAAALNVPMLILKKQASQILNEGTVQTEVYSFTKQTKYQLTVKKMFIKEGENILLIDDFLAHGEAAFGAIRLIEACGAKVKGIGVVIAKTFQNGLEKLENAGYKVEVLAKIKRLDEGIIEFEE